MMAQADTDEIFAQGASFIKKELMAIHAILGVSEKSGSLINLLQEMSRMVLVDELTGLANRFYFDRRLPIEIQKTTQKKEPLSLVTLGIDDLKNINRNSGFKGGDEIIRQVASLLSTRIQSAQSLMRQRYLYTRYCGGQFYILLPGTTQHSAAVGAQRLRQKIENTAFVCDGRQIPVTASFGITQWKDPMKHPGELVQSANLALQEAKNKGPNRCAEAP